MAPLIEDLDLVSLLGRGRLRQQHVEVGPARGRKQPVRQGCQQYNPWSSHDVGSRQVKVACAARSHHTILKSVIPRFIALGPVVAPAGGGSDTLPLRAAR